MIPPLTGQGETDDNCSLMSAAIVLSGGASRRMGRPKALLTLDGETFISRIVRVMREAGIDTIVVVTGVHHDAIAEHLAGERGGASVRVLPNRAVAADQLSSLRVALAALDEAVRADGIIVALVDHPLIDVETLTDMLAVFATTSAPVVRPVFEGRRGHPVIFGRDAVEMLRHGELREGARSVVRAFESRQALVPTLNPGVLVDVDTPEVYRGLAGADPGLVGSPMIHEPDR